MTSSPQAPAPAVPPRAAGAGPSRLTRREQAALLARAAGYTNAAAAARYGISVGTLHRSLRSARDRLGVPTVTRAVAVAVACGDIPAAAVRDGALPLWPVETDTPAGLSRAQKRAAFGRLRAQDVPIQEAAARLRVGQATGYRWEHDREAGR